MQKIKILYVLGAFGSGGVESVVSNIHENIDHSKFKIDFVLFNGLDHSRKTMLERFGSEIYYIERSGKGIVRNIYQIYEILKKNKYNIIHAHTNETSLLSALAGRLAGTQIILCHSHNTSFRKHDKYVPYIRFLFRALADQLVACSYDAGAKLFGKNAKFIIFKNAINHDKFKFNESLRIKVRKQLGLEDKFVIGNVGRLISHKNHKFLLEVFKKVADNNKNAVLLIVGDGELENEIMSHTKKLQLDSKVKLLGARDDINELLQAMDLFLFPSRFEGLGVSLIEAQSAGLPCVASDVIPKEVAITNLIDFVSLDKSSSYWGDIVLSQPVRAIREDTSSDIINAGYDIKNSTRNLEEVYVRLLENKG